MESIVNSLLRVPMGYSRIVDIYMLRHVHTSKRISHRYPDVLALVLQDPQTREYVYESRETVRVEAKILAMAICGVPRHPHHADQGATACRHPPSSRLLFWYSPHPGY